MQKEALVRPNSITLNSNAPRSSCLRRPQLSALGSTPIASPTWWNTFPHRIDQKVRDEWHGLFFDCECCYGPDSRYIDGGLRHASSGTAPVPRTVPSRLWYSRHKSAPFFASLALIKGNLKAQSLRFQLYLMVHRPSRGKGLRHSGMKSSKYLRTPAISPGTAWSSLMIAQRSLSLCLAFYGPAIIR